MSAMAKSSRTKLKNKARKLASETVGKVDSSEFTPAEPINSDIKTGMRPLSRRAFKKGGKVMGESEAPRADKAKRKSEATEFAEAKVNRNVKDANEKRPGGKAHVGGYKEGGDVPLPPKRPPQKVIDRMSSEKKDVTDPKDWPSDLTYSQYKKGGRTGKADGGEASGVSTKRFNFGSNLVTPGQKRGGKVAKHDDEAMDRKLINKMVKPSARTGKAEGGESEDGKWIQKAIKHPGALRKELHVKKGENIPEKKLEKAEHSKNPTLAKRARLAENLKRMNRKDGGRAKGKTNINIVIASGKPGEGGDMPAKGLPPQLPQRMPVPAPAPSPGGLPMGAGPMPPAGPAGPAPMPPGLAGGMPTPRKSGGRLTAHASSYKDMEAGAGSGEGRLQKTDIAKARMGRMHGGRTYKSYKDMRAGAGSGEGRLEKSEIQRHKGVR